RRVHTAFRRGHQPGDLEPHAQRCACAVEQCPPGHRDLPAAAPAPVPSGGLPTCGVGLAVRADEPVGPTQPVEVAQARLIRGEPGPQLRDVHRVVLPATGMTVGLSTTYTPSWCSPRSRLLAQRGSLPMRFSLP